LYAFQMAMNSLSFLGQAGFKSGSSEVVPEFRTRL
jgi:hypothetical protein